MAIPPGGPTGAPSSGLDLLQNLNFHPYTTHFRKVYYITTIDETEYYFSPIALTH